MVVGTYAEYAVVPAARLVTLPAHVELKTAAAVMLQGTTAHYLTTSTFPLNPGDTVAGACGGRRRRAADRAGRADSRARA